MTPSVYAYCSCKLLRSNQQPAGKEIYKIYPVSRGTDARMALQWFPENSNNK